MPSEPLIFSFPDASAAEGNRLSANLADALRDVDPGITWIAAGNRLIHKTLAQL